MFGYEFGDVVNFKVVLHPRNEISRSRWFPTVVVSFLERGPILQLFFDRKQKNRLRKCKLRVNVVLS